MTNNFSGQPQMRAAFSGWRNRITLNRRIQAVDPDTGFVTTMNQPFTFRGVIQPLGPKQLELKPDGQRAWEWIMIHTSQARLLTNGDQIVYNGAIFKAMGINDYSLNGYIEYHLVRDYQDGVP